MRVIYFQLLTKARIHIMLNYIRKFPGTQFFKIKKVSDKFMKDFGDHHPKEITTYQPKDWFLKILEEEQCFLKSVSNYRTQLKTIFTYMNRYGHLSESPHG